MKLSAQEEFGLRCLITLASQGPGASMTIPEISAKEGLSNSHVAKLMGILRRAGIVASLRGQAGGYQLAVPPEEIHLGNVLAELGGRLYVEGHCDHFRRSETECTHGSECTIRALWERVQSAVDSVVGTMTLADLLTTGKAQPVVVYDQAPVVGSRRG